VGFKPQSSAGHPREHKLEVKATSKSTGKVIGGKRKIILLSRAYKACSPFEFACLPTPRSGPYVENPRLNTVLRRHLFSIIVVYPDAYLSGEQPYLSRRLIRIFWLGPGRGSGWFTRIQHDANGPTPD
jgi:hypothetical protein